MVVEDPQLPQFISQLPQEDSQMPEEDSQLPQDTLDVPGLHHIVHNLLQGIPEAHSTPACSGLLPQEDSQLQQLPFVVEDSQV